MSLQQPSQPVPAQPSGTTTAPGTLPPVMLYLPSIMQSPKNSALRIAQLIAIKASKGPGTYAVEDLLSPSASAHLTDGQRIVKTGSGPVLDVYTVDYRPLLKLPQVSGGGIGATLRRLAFALSYFFRTLLLVLSARRRAKSRVAKLQLVIGFGVVVVLLLSVVFTVLAVLAALGLWKEPPVSGNAADAIALGATAFATWLFFNVRPAVQQGATLIEQLLDYAQDERHAAGVTGILDSALDDLLEDNLDRKVHVFGYSLGALVAMDFLYPRKSLLQLLDERHAKAILTLVTVGCPVDFIRLYVPQYMDEREARAPDVHWTNIYIPADVLGSNLTDGDDFVESPDTGTGVSGYEAGPHRQEQIAIAGKRPLSQRYTSEQLTLRNIWGRRGFLSHGGYWDEPEHENCLHLVMHEVMPVNTTIKSDSSP
jgi:hypothetical protein